MSEQLLKAIALAFKINADEWIATLKDGDDWLSEDQIGGEVAKLISEKVTAAKTQSRKNGQGEQNAKVLKAVKATGFENPDNLSGEELVSAFIVWKDEQVVTPPEGTPVDQMDLEAILKLPIVKNEILRVKQESGKGNDQLKAELAAYKVEVEKERSKSREERALDVIRLRTPEALKKGNVVLKVDGISEADRIEAVIDRILLREKYGLDAKGEPIFFNDKGEPKEDEFGNQIPFFDTVIGYGKSMYGISTQDQNHEGATLPSSNGVPGAKDYAPKMRFANQTEYDNFKMNTTDPEQRKEATLSWQFQQQKAAGN